MQEPEKRSLTDKFMLRLPDGMRDRVKAAADAEGRSMNAEIIVAIARHLHYYERGLSNDHDLEINLDSKTDMAKDILNIIEKYINNSAKNEKER